MKKLRALRQDVSRRLLFRAAQAGNSAFSGQPIFSLATSSFQFSLTASLTSFKSAFCRPIDAEASWRLRQACSSVENWSCDSIVEEHKQGPPSLSDWCNATLCRRNSPGNTSVCDTAGLGILPRVTRNARDCVPRFISNARVTHVALEASGVVFQSRAYASKTKKAKSRTEVVSDDDDDVALIAREIAIKMMETALDVLSKEHAKLRTGRVSAGMLDHITVDAHGVRTPLSHIAAVTVLGQQTLHVLPYDASMVKEVEKAILSSPLGLNPQIDGVTLVVPLPRLTKEHCETMCKLASKAGEGAKLTIRRARKEALDSIKRSGSLSKDESKRFEKEVDELTKKYTKLIDETCKRKDREILA